MFRYSPTLAMNNLIKIRESKNLETYKLGFGQSPFPVPQILVEALKENAHKKDYLNSQGLLELRESISSYVEDKLDTSISPDQIIIGPGSKELIFLSQLILERNLILPAPSWVSYAPQSALLKQKTHYIPTRFEDKFLLSPSDLGEFLNDNKDEKHVLVINYPNNPTGQSYTTDQLKELAVIARAHNLVIISDEIYSEFCFGHEHVSIKKFYPEGTIICNGLSKWCGAGGWRLGYMIYPKEMQKELEDLIYAASESYSCASTPIQYAAQYAFQNDDTIASYTQKCNYILNQAQNIFANRLDQTKMKFHPSAGGFYIFLEFNKDFYKYDSSIKLCNDLLSDTGVALLAGTHFGMSDEYLSARLAYVDFNGEEKLNRLKNSYLEDNIINLEQSHLMIATDKMNNWTN
ncbi:MAG: pyridoxal phosphate-dependent aminotransferase [Saprospiraceae bacterium]|nr:pyridoxal phosphate-dependent aminotransferase [Bacteroidia bacterium]NNL92288.1 pyridoxal phosphate-dependent aminotransferase [Saprospiraceae bacterium]